jgi:hypothetical protein
MRTDGSEPHCAICQPDEHDKRIEDEWQKKYPPGDSTFAPKHVPADHVRDAPKMVDQLELAEAVIGHDLSGCDSVVVKDKDLPEDRPMSEAESIVMEADFKRQVGEKVRWLDKIRLDERRRTISEITEMIKREVITVPRDFPAIGNPIINTTLMWVLEKIKGLK